jgi:hypothetical protein
MPPTILSSPAHVARPTPFASAKAAMLVTPALFREGGLSHEDSQEELDMEPIALFEEGELLNDPLLHLPINNPSKDSNAQPGGKKRGPGLLPLEVPKPKTRQCQDSSLLGTFGAISAVATLMRNSGRNRQHQRRPFLGSGRFSAVRAKTNPWWSAASPSLGKKSDG